MSFYSFDMKMVNSFFHTYTKLLTNVHPKMSDLLITNGVNGSLFLFEWTVSVFTNSLPLNLAARLWDTWLFFKDIRFHTC